MSQELSKANLIKVTGEIKSYESFLPALNLRKKQITLKISEINKQLSALLELLQQKIIDIKQQFPMSAVSNLNYQDYLEIHQIPTFIINIAGVKLPDINPTEFAIKNIELETNPFWFYSYLKDIQTIIYLQQKSNILQQQIVLLTKEAQKITQKINIFEKIILPKRYQLVKNIKIFLEDQNRANVVACKIAKQKRLSS